MVHNPLSTSVLYAGRHLIKCSEMHIYNVADFTCRLHIRVYKFSVYLHSDVLKWISVGLFPLSEPLAHVTTVWRPLNYVLPTLDTKKLFLRDQNRQKLNCFIVLSPDTEMNRPWIYESSGCRCLK